MNIIEKKYNNIKYTDNWDKIFFLPYFKNKFCDDENEINLHFDIIQLLIQKKNSILIFLISYKKKIIL